MCISLGLAREDGAMRKVKQIVKQTHRQGLTNCDKLASAVAAGGFILVVLDRRAKWTIGC